MKRMITPTWMTTAGLLTVALLGGCMPSLTSQSDKNATFRASHQDAFEAIDARYTHRYLEAGGVRWHYVEAGQPDGPVVLLLHGLPECWYSWNKVLPLLDPAYHYIVPDMKGYGRSTSSDPNYTWHHTDGALIEMLQKPFWADATLIFNVPDRAGAEALLVSSGYRAFLAAGRDHTAIFYA